MQIQHAGDTQSV